MQCWVHIKRVSAKSLCEVIENRTPCGLFLAKEGHKWVAVDNSIGDAWTEEFPRKRSLAPMAVFSAFRFLREPFRNSLKAPLSRKFRMAGYLYGIGAAII